LFWDLDSTEGSVQKGDLKKIFLTCDKGHLTGDILVDDYAIKWEPVFDGLLSTIYEGLTGFDPNISERFSPQNRLFYDIWTGETSPLEALVGPGGAIVGQTVKDGYRAMNTAAYAMMDAMNIEHNEGVYKVLASDVMDFLSNRCGN